MKDTVTDKTDKETCEQYYRKLFKYGTHVYKIQVSILYGIKRNETFVIDLDNVVTITNECLAISKDVGAHLLYIKGKYGNIFKLYELFPGGESDIEHMIFDVTMLIIHLNEFKLILNNVFTSNTNQHELKNASIMMNEYHHDDESLSF